MPCALPLFGSKSLFCVSFFSFFPNSISSDMNRWQDGAIVANNPTVFAMREAQLLWPDTRIDTLVSIGCGSVPTKVVAFLFGCSKSQESPYLGLCIGI